MSNPVSYTHLDVYKRQPFISPMVTRNVTACTGACMAISKDVIDKIGGFEERFIICGSDVEICIRAIQEGYRNVYIPQVQLYHYESKSRDSYIPEIDFELSDIMYMGYRKGGDPYYNKNLDINSCVPVVKKVQEIPKADAKRISIETVSYTHLTHIQRKGTKFVSEASQDLKCEQCIFMDIFPFDYVAADQKAAVRQGRKANILGKLLFLSGSAYPLIPFGGFKGKIAALGCKLIHILLKLIRITPQKLYKRFVEVSTAYNNSDGRSEYVTSFEYAGCLKDRIKKNGLFPMKEVQFENLRVNIPANNHRCV